MPTFLAVLMVLASNNDTQKACQRGQENLFGFVYTPGVPTRKYRCHFLLVTFSFLQRYRLAVVLPVFSVVPFERCICF